MRQLHRGSGAAAVAGILTWHELKPKMRTLSHPPWGGLLRSPVQSSKVDAIRRLNSIEGHLRGIRKMVEEDAYCVDVLKQTYAVQRAIDKFEQVVLRGHLAHCVPGGIRDGRDGEVLGELEELFALSRR